MKHFLKMNNKDFPNWFLFVYGIVNYFIASLIAYLIMK